ncbi:hypothetical protein N1031_06615 [Herbiconiux moechotypicola]|uniref:Secreted protein n=1 Tax=Herbiconiux moechotypicola TaxID=637393 RepID=A0ABN3DFQ1_9MICO|nr:hypothetical protein [Herbiconiux moechotypicola]MCS5729430.1 hypothetical protein [Herbiconiux moechotypicola]
MNPAADRRRRRLLIAATAGGLALLILVGGGIYGLLRGPATPAPETPGRTSPSATATPGRPDAPAPEAVSPFGGPVAFARNIAAALFAWDTASGYGPADYAQVIADVAHPSEADALVTDVRAYLPATEAWAQLRQYQTRQWMTIDDVFVPDAWETALTQAAPGQIPDGATAITVTGTRHRDGIWDTTPVEASRPVAFTVFMICTPPIPGRGGTGACELLRLSALDNPLR